MKCRKNHKKHRNDFTMTNPRQFPAIFLTSNLAPIGARQLTRKMAEIFELKKNITKLTKKKSKFLPYWKLSSSERSSGRFTVLTEETGLMLDHKSFSSEGLVF